MAQISADTDAPTAKPNDTAHQTTMKSKRKLGPGGADGNERKRVSQACDQCRSKKLKCDGGKPACTSCVSLGRQCQYGSVVKKRGLPEGYVRGLEKLLGLLITKEQQGEGSVGRLFSEALGNGNKRAELMAMWNGGEDGDSLPELWRNSQLSKALETLLPDLDSAEGRVHEYKKPRLEPHSMNYGKEDPATGPRYLRGLPPQDEAEALFEIYFTYTHCWLPILGRDETYALYYRSLELSESSLESGEHATLWAILAYAETQRACMSIRGQGEAPSQSATGKAYYEKARGLIPSEGQDFKIGHVQAFLVLSLLNLSLGQLSTAWLLVGQAVNVAIDIGLGKALTFYEMEHPTENNSRRKNVFLGCFCLDTLIAARLERCPRLIKEDAQLVGQLDENGLAEWGHWKTSNGRDQRFGPSRSISTFNQFVRLNYVLNDSIRETYLGVAGEEAFDNAHNRLYIWKKQLPAHCWLKNSSATLQQQEPILPHQLNLNLMFVISMALLALRCNGPQESLKNTMKKYPDHSQVPLQIMDQLRSSISSYGSAVLPSTAQVLMGLLGELEKRNTTTPHGAWSDSLWRLSAQMASIWPVEHQRQSRQSKQEPGGQDNYEAPKYSPGEGSPNERRTSRGYDEQVIKDQSPQQRSTLNTYDPAIQSPSDQQSSKALGTNDFGSWLRNQSASNQQTVDNLAIEDPSTYSAAGDLFYFAQASRSGQLSAVGSDTSQVHPGEAGKNPDEGE
ncbi:hypothetical protein BP5796_01922 [Coleophoma crateriformis]|uniref:Zn(2)-C6 fungal-type domain-containing protein n=1 Tax=Coleophoma crateriformis TaxID=565419 RepID=A0A3D8T3F5_9HELO|nr:hypothetical protein BP5796_01922 [Coleophoma crateriformis]